MSRLQFYSSVAYSIAGEVYTLDDIEHGVLRGNRASLLAPTFFSSGKHFSEVRGQSSVL